MPKVYRDILYLSSHIRLNWVVGWWCGILNLYDAFDVIGQWIHVNDVNIVSQVVTSYSVTNRLAEESGSEKETDAQKKNSNSGCICVSRLYWRLPSFWGKRSFYFFFSCTIVDVFFDVVQNGKKSGSYVLRRYVHVQHRKLHKLNGDRYDRIAAAQQHNITVQQKINHSHKCRLYN